MAFVFKNSPSSAASSHQHFHLLWRGCTVLPCTRTNTTYSTTTHVVSSRAQACMTVAQLPASVPDIKLPSGDHRSLLHRLRQTQDVPGNNDSSMKLTRLRERAQLALRKAPGATGAMKLIDALQHLGIGYLFEDDISSLLERFSNDQHDYNDVYTTSLCFRLLRRNGYDANPDVFGKFIDKNGQFKEPLKRDIQGMLSLHEASYLGGVDEHVLSQHAMEFTEKHLKQLIPDLEPRVGKHVIESLELPRHLRMARLESRRFITSEHNNASRERDHSNYILELATLDYNAVQSLHQAELAEISRWWRQLGLVEKLTFGRDRPTECYLWAVGILPEPKYSDSRIELTKTVAILLVIDDIFDTYGSLDELVLFTEAIQRWDLSAMGRLPEYMKICYMALYNSTNEIAYGVMKRNGWNAVTYLKETWIHTIEGYLVESKWFSSKYTTNLEEYLENGVTTAGSYMALVHIFFLIGEGVTEETARLMIKPYPKLFSCSGRILRLWDDLGTATEEQERGGDVASSIECLMREKKLSSESEGRKQVKKLIHGLWKDMNGELVVQKGLLSLPIMNACLNMSRTAQVIYQHGDNSIFSSVDDCVKSLLFNPINIKPGFGPVSVSHQS